MTSISHILPEIDHAFRQFVFECMDLTDTDDDSNIVTREGQPTQRDIPYDDPYPFFKAMMAPEETPADDKERPHTPLSDPAVSGE